MTEQSLPKHQVFVIYGRDQLAHEHLARFIEALGLEELAFERISNQLGPAPFIADIVTTSIEQADAVIVLFTPDEHAALFGKKDEANQSESERYLIDEEGGTRWQARPNVLFEAGVAYGTKPEKTVLVTIGTDVRLFSDMGGKHFVQLAEEGGKRKLRSRLEAILGPLKPERDDWETPEVSGDFARCLRPRWGFYDEIGKLESHLRFRSIRECTLLDIVAEIAWLDVKKDWRVLRETDFITAIGQRFGKTVANESYWWLIVYGFFQFSGVDVWFEDGKGEPRWTDSINYARWTERAFALIERCRARPRPSLGQSPTTVFSKSRSKTKP